MIYKDRKYDYLLMCGDIHGNFDVIPKFIKDNELSNCAVFQVGDFGVGFETEHNDNKKLLYLNGRMKHSNSDLFVIRGNHDKPSYFENEYNQSNLFLLKDYSVVDINNIKILGIGGAISVDRTTRSGYWNEFKKHNYWRNEGVVVDYDKLSLLNDIDIVCTHTSPNFVTPLTKGGINEFLLKDKELDNDITEERHNMSMIYNKLIQKNNIKNWYHGHFHRSCKSYINDTIFTSLNINEIVDLNLIYF